MALASPYSTHAPTFNPVEIIVALAFAGFVQGAFFGLLIAAGKNDLRIRAKQEVLPPEVPMAVKPILDDAPLLKLGGKKMKPKLPEMWKKQEPLPVERFEESSAPSEKAVDKPEAIPTSSVAKGDAEAPPPDAEIAKSVDEQVATADAAPPAATGEGAADGVKDGTETDPLKARAVGIYRSKIIAWFNARFKPPVGEVPCEELKKMSSGVSASLSPDGTVTGFSVNRPSGNGAFDGRVQSAMQSAVGQQVPPPPPMYKDVLPPSVSLSFLGSSAKCE